MACSPEPGGILNTITSQQHKEVQKTWQEMDHGKDTCWQCEAGPEKETECSPTGPRLGPGTGGDSRFAALCLSTNVHADEVSTDWGLQKHFGKKGEFITVESVNNEDRLPNFAHSPGQRPILVHRDVQCCPGISLRS